MNSRRKSSIAAAVHLRWWQMRTLSISGCQSLQNGRLDGVIEYAFRFDDASEIAAKVTA